MDKVSKISLKSSKRKDKDLSKKSKNLTKQGLLEEELHFFNTNENTVNLSINKESISDSTDPNRNVIGKKIKKEVTETVENNETNDFSVEADINEVYNSMISAIILNLPFDATTEELSNFLSKRGIPVDALSIDNGRYAVIESSDENSFIKIKNLIANKPFLNSEHMRASKLLGNAQRLEAFCQKNTILNRSIVIVRNINNKTKIDDILSLVSDENEIKKHQVIKVRNRKNRTQMLTIEFVSHLKTENVIKKLNGIIIDDNKLTAEFKHKLVEDCAMEPKSLTLLIRNLPESTDYETIKNFELPCSKIELVKKSAKRLCFLTFRSTKEVSEAYELLSNKEVNGVKLLVKFVDFKTEKQDEDVDKTKLHITNLPFSCTKEDMEKEFDMAESLKFPLSASGKSKGCCYLTFGSEELAALAMEGFKDKIINGRKIKCNYVKKNQFSNVSENKSKKPTKRKLEGNVITLFNLPKTVIIEDIKSKFEHVKFVNIVKKDDVFKGIAEVHFTNPNFAKVAVDAPEFSIKGRVIRKELKGGKWRVGVEKIPRIVKPSVQKNIKD